MGPAAAPGGRLVGGVIGRFQPAVAVQALVMGGNVRVGMEDTAYFRKGELARSNAQLVERVVRLARELGREAAGPRAGS